jgi:hypothetical protein
VDKTKEKYVILSIVCYVHLTFDVPWLLVSSTTHANPSIVQVIIDLFEVHDTISATMANQVKTLLNSFNLFNKIVACVKDEGSNLSTLTFVISCLPFS